MITKVYLAGASAEIERARTWAQRLRDADIHVMSTWVDVVGKVGAANPKDATPEQLAKWTLRDLAEVNEANVLWLLLPKLEVSTVGAWIELGAAYTAGKYIVMSGPHRPIFTPVLNHWHAEDDESAFTHLQNVHKRSVLNQLDHYRDLHAKQYKDTNRA